MLIALHYLAALGGGIIIILAFVGLGRMVQRFTLEGGSISKAIALGFAVNLLIGGLLNLVNAISLGSVLAIEFVGLLGVYFDRQKLVYEIKSYYKDPYAIAVLAVFYVMSVTNVVFNRYAGPL
jgi:hypothetical protein